jgi:hypothetical protein
MKAKKARKPKALHRGKKLEAKKPLFVAVEHGASSGKVTTQSFGITKFVDVPSN